MKLTAPTAAPTMQAGPLPLAALLFAEANLTRNHRPAARPNRRWAMMAALAVMGFLLGLQGGKLPLVGSAVGRHTNRPEGPPSAGPPLPPTLNLPSPGLAPEQVVQAQMSALARCRQDRSSIHQVRAFASSANRAATGTIGQFEKMILTPPYDTMVVNRCWRAGRAAQHGDVATVLVTVVGPNNEIGLFRFYLSRNADEAEGSWLTDHVFCLTGGGPVNDDPTPFSI